MRRFSLVSLFSGAGGLDLGFVLSGFYSVVFANDVLLPAVQTYSRNFGLKPRYCGGAVEAEAGTALACDVVLVDFTPLRDLEVDVVTGGPPCQDFSIVRGPEGKRRGVEARRGRLYAHFVRALATLRPKAFVFENVPGLASANRGLAYKAVLEDFSHLNTRWSEVGKTAGSGVTGGPEEGYEIVFSGVADFTKLGVPQMRKRLIVVGIRRDLLGGSPERLLEVSRFFAYKLGGGDALFRKYPLTPIEVFEGRRLDELDEAYREVVKKWDGVWLEVDNEHAWRWKREVWDRLALNIIEDYLLLNGVHYRSREELERALEEHEALLKELGYYGRRVEDIDPPDGSNRLPRETREVLERLRRIPPGENHEFVKGTRWEIKGLMSNTYRRAFPLTPAPTVLAYGGGGTWGYHYERRRGMLTNRERARLQTFPDNFLFTGTQSQMRAQIGEAVPPLAGRAIAEALAHVLNSIT